MFYLGWFIFFVLLMRLLVALINLCSPLYLKRSILKGNPMLSLLIPARNEEENLPRLLESIAGQEYKNFEVIIYNDNSTDQTREIINTYEAKDKRVKGITGGELPDGWTGKNRGCHLLSQQAKGDYYLFLDADVWLNDPDFFQKALSYMQRKNLSLLTMFPHQIMHTTGEKITVPVMNWILLSFLPLFLVRISRWKAFSAANGQMMMFTSVGYDKHKWHEQVKNELVEDIIIMRKLKKRTLDRAERKSTTLLGNNDIHCRMYHSLDEGIKGFSKNVIQFFGGYTMVMLFFTLYFLGSLFVVWLTLPNIFTLIFILMIIMLRASISIKSKQPVFMNVFLHIPQLICFLFIVLRSLINKNRKKTVWKMREINYA